MPPVLVLTALLIFTGANAHAANPPISKMPTREVLVLAIQSSSRDEIVAVQTIDAEMNDAIDHARATWPKFIDAILHRSAQQTGFCLKVRFQLDDQVEHIWLADLDLSKEIPEGTIANEPKLPGLSFMHHVQFQLSDITDWMYVQDGQLVGGYTTRLIRSRLSIEERAIFDAATPYKVQDAGLER